MIKVIVSKRSNHTKVQTKEGARERRKKEERSKGVKRHGNKFNDPI
jgi:hypothetical protein